MMLSAVTRCRRTQKGNNNAYCQDNDTSWFDWRLVAKHTDVFRFVRSRLIRFPPFNQPTVRRELSFLTGEPVDGRLIQGCLLVLQRTGEAARLASATPSQYGCLHRGSE